MTAQHFTEFIDIIKLSTGLSENEIGLRIEKSGVVIRQWKKRGIPIYRAHMICNRLRKVVREAV